MIIIVALPLSVTWFWQLAYFILCNLVQTVTCVCYNEKKKKQATFSAYSFSLYTPQVEVGTKCQLHSKDQNQLLSHLCCYTGLTENDGWED